MLRSAAVLAALALVAGSTTQAHAGRRCVKRPQPVFVGNGAQLLEDGHYIRTIGETTKLGRLAPSAVARVERIAFSVKPAQVVKCIDALIADEHGKAAKRACAQPASS